VITLALILAAVGILTIGREQGLFRDRVPFRTDFPNVDGLAEGAPVRFIGVQVGVVTRISLPAELGKDEVEVEFAVDRAVRDRIRTGSTATLKNLTYLSGEKYVELKPGDPGAPPIPEGGYVDSPRSEVEQLIAQSQTIAANIETISVQFTELLDHLNKGDSVLSQLIKDPTFGREAVEEATQAIAGVNSIVSRIDRGEGLLGRLLADEEYGGRTSDALARILDRLDRISAGLEQGDGLLGQMLAADSELSRLQDDLAEAVAAIAGLVGQLESGQGMLGRMLVDEEYGRTMTARLEAALADVNEILAKINEGEGTLGLLLNEPELYQDATDVVGGLSDSRFLKWVAKRMRNKEIKSKIEEYARELEEAERADRP
jgi:phospholipid/cholesterol/gamma-HCH transport system substrate-binding protein